MDDVLKTFEGEFYLHPESGKVHKRLPAGGNGGGVTSYADTEASESEALAYFNHMAERKTAEVDTLKERHDEAEVQLAEHREAESSDVVKVDGAKEAEREMADSTADVS